jgi:hypothetical protein
LWHTKTFAFNFPVAYILGACAPNATPPLGLWYSATSIRQRL